MKSKSLLITLLALIISTGVTGQKTWTGTTSTAWNTSTNWSPAGAPGATDNVTIPSAPANQPLISGSLTPVCNNLTINTGASLTISSTITNQAMLTASGNAIINGSLSLTGVATTTLKVVNITWGSGSSMTGSISGGIQVSGNWEFSTGSSASMGYSTVTFLGGTNSTITSNSVNSNFHNLVLSKTGGATVNTSATSTSTLTINGNINISSGVSLVGQANITTILKGNLVNAGNINMSSGTLSFERTSGTQSVQININDFFNSININTGGTVTISTSYIMQLMGNMNIQAGVLDPGGSTIGLFGNWTNTVGTAGFTEGTGTVIFNGGNYHQYCSNETFYTLEVHKTVGGALRMNGTTVTCSNYNWTAGAIDVLNGGTFTANNITDDAIAGSYYCNANCTINLYNYGGNIDLRGNLYIYGGNFNVYGGNNPSWWPYLGNASITMSGGVLNIADQGILIRTDGTYTFTTNITGGTIKTAGSFTNGRSDFIPVAGTLELAGAANTNLTMNAGSLFNLTINKPTANTATLATNATINGILTVQSGTFLANNRILFTNENITVSNGGTLFLENGAILRVKGNKALTIASGGTLKAIGTSVSKPIITDNAASGYHEFHVNGTISARNAIFEYNYGINIWSTATVDPLNPFDQCTFSYGIDRFLLFSNNQELMIREANFPTAPVFNNVYKNNNAGRINFRDATGAYAGQAYENDPYNRIDWTTTQPGLWTGAVSTDWHTAANWDDLLVPDAAKNVTIPTGVTNMPVVNAAANCNTLTLNGTLTIGNATLQVAGNAAISGNITMTHSSGILTFNNDVAWNSGSTATIPINSSIRAYGNWDFNAGANVQFGFGTVTFLGTVSKELRSYSANCAFYNISISKTGGANVSLSALSTQPLTVNSNFRVESGSLFKSYSNYHLIVNTNILVYGTMQCEAGAVKLDGATQSLMPNVNDYFNHLIFSQTGTASINTTYTSTLNVKGNLHIDSGVFEAGNCTINVGGNWDNNIGSAAFTAGLSRVVFNGGNYHQYVLSNESFCTLELNKPLGGSLRMNDGPIGNYLYCQIYDWTAGAIDVLNGGTFYVTNLAEDIISGTYYCNPNCTIALYGGPNGLGGNLFIYGGNFYVNFSSQCTWPYGGNASITMSGGLLNFYGSGADIYIMNDDLYTFTSNITGGIIATDGNFNNFRNDFIPAAGTVELKGTTNSNLTMTAGSLYNLIINKASANTVTLATNATINGALTVQSGTFLANNKTLFTNENISVDNGGTLTLENEAILKVKGSKALTVNSGGTLKAIGTSSSKPIITDNAASGYHEFHVNGTISARYAIFEYNNGINIWPTATVDPLNPFDQCTFSYGIDRFLLFSNNQELMIRGANFPTAPLYNNVWKNNNSGRVNFRDATGAYAGQAYENDPYNRIDWTTTQPGLWTGAVSTNWHTAANWDDLVVPDATKSVTIPTGVTNMPVVSAGANCNNLTLNGTLTIGNATLQVAGNAAVSGNITMTHSSGILTFISDVAWNSGSTATIPVNSSILAYGNWDFNEGANVQFGFGTVTFPGTVSKELRSYSANCAFFNISISKTGGANVSLSALSTQPLTVNSNFRVESGSLFKSFSNFHLIINANMLVYGTMQCEAGAVKLDGNTQSLMPNVNDYFNHLIFSQTGTASINTTYISTLNVKGNLHIDSGVFEAENCTINIGGNWDNNIGTAAFIEGGSKVVFNGGNYHQYLYNNETFNILELNKPLGGALRINNGAVGHTLICNVYDWAAGAIDVMNGATFTANDLADEGISGMFYCNPGCTINLTNTGGSIDLRGNLYMYGGNFNVFGGNDMSRWGEYSNALLTMSDGVIDFKNQGILINDSGPFTFSSDISGGTIRTPYSIYAQSPGFNPTGGIVEIYGAANAHLLSSNGAAFYDVIVNKPGFTQRIYVTSADVKNNLTIAEGMAEVPFDSELKCGNNLVIQDGGWLAISSGTLSMMNLSSVNVLQNGYFSTFGYEGGQATVKAATSTDIFTFTAHSGSLIDATFTVFENLSPQGIYIGAGATIAPSYSFTNCEFRKGSGGPGTLLTINNDQDLVIENAIFPANTLGGQSNVRKEFDQGNVTFVNATGAFAGEAFEDDPFGRIHWGAPKQLNLTLFLEGLYNGTNSMRQVSDEYGPHFGTGIADQITVELRNAANYNTIVHLADHVNLNTNGTVSVTIPGTLSGSYYITIRHRNSVTTTTAAPVSFASGTISYSFNQPSQAYGGNLLQMVTGQYVIFSGDVNQDGFIDTGDITPVDNDAANYATGYLDSDVNGDGITDTADMTIVDNNAAGYVGSMTP
ncbi:MAG: hypothetical protein AB9834_14350 [Lentimicrobium sp.]